MDTSNNISELLSFNQRFVRDDLAAPFRADKKPRKHLAIVACMDTRLTTMLTAALGLENGDANLIKVAGAEVGDSYGSVMRSLLVAVYELDVEDILVVAHTECGAQHMSAPEMTALMKEAGIEPQAFEEARATGVDLATWLEGFGDTEQAVRKNVAAIQDHRLIPAHVRVQGFIIETQTGELIPVV